MVHALVYCSRMLIPNLEALAAIRHASRRNYCPFGADVWKLLPVTVGRVRIKAVHRIVAVDGIGVFIP